MLDDGPLRENLLVRVSRMVRDAKRDRPSHTATVCGFRGTEGGHGVRSPKSKDGQ
jgi:hypothetical protein